MQILIQSNLSLTVTNSDKCMKTYTDTAYWCQYWYGQFCQDMTRYVQVIERFGKIWPSHAKLWTYFTKVWKMMARYCLDKLGKFMAKYLTIDLHNLVISQYHFKIWLATLLHVIVNFVLNWEVIHRWFDSKNLIITF